MHRLPEMGLEVSWLRKQEVVRLLPQQKNWEEEWDFCREHKPAGRKPHFYHSFNFDFLSGEVSSLPFRWLAVSRLLCPSRAFELNPLCVWHRQTQPCSAPWRWHIHTACLPRQITAVMSELAPGCRDHGGEMWSILSWQMLKCDCGAERLFIDRVNKLQDA